MDPTTVVPSKGYSEEEEIGLISGSEKIGEKPTVNKPLLEAVPPTTPSGKPGTQPPTSSVNQSAQQSISTPSSEKQPQLTNNNTPDKPKISTGTVPLAPTKVDGINAEANNEYLAPGENESGQPIPVTSQLINEGKVEPGKLTVETVLDYLAPQTSGSFQGISAISSDINYIPPNEDDSIKADKENSKVGKNNNQDFLKRGKPSGSTPVSPDKEDKEDKENGDDHIYNPLSNYSGLGISTSSDKFPILTDDNLETYVSSINQPEGSLGKDQDETKQKNKDSDPDTIKGKQDGNRNDINQDQSGSSDLSSYQTPTTSSGSTVDESEPIPSLEAYGVGSETAEVIDQETESENTAKASDQETESENTAGASDQETESENTAKASDQEAESEDALMLDMKDMKEFKV